MATADYEMVRFNKLKHIKFLVNRISMRKEHSHNEFEIAVLLRGKAFMTVEERTFELNEGDVVFINSSEIHSYRNATFGDAPIFLFAQISNHCFYDYFPEIRTTVFESCMLSDFYKPDELNELKTILFDSAAEYFSDKPRYQLPLLSHIAAVLNSLYTHVPFAIITEKEKGAAKARHARMERIINYIDENFESRIRLQDIADMEKLTPTHFSHLFSSMFHVTFQNYVTHKSTEQCVRLMAQTEKTILEICYESGFSDPKYMNAAFMKEFGCSPKEFRLRMNQRSLDLHESIDEFEHIFSFEESNQILDKYRQSIR